MAKKRGESGRWEAPEAQNTALADLLKAKGLAPAEMSQQPPTPAQKPAPPADGVPDLSRVAKVVLRRERKGRGGKTVTLVEGLGLRPAELEAVARAMRKGLGCGSSVEGGVIVLQGDIVPRAQSWLTARGVKKVVAGN